ncbi:Integrase core domain-containing protein isoform 2 [Cladophialophora immunda]|nr:Integrase core domain-containing protein isoform 2 [Cladophialophora immunda]
MGGSNNRKNRLILQGKSNYAVWLPACEMELRAQECYTAISRPVVVNPETLDTKAKAKATSDFLARKQPRPEKGFDIPTLDANYDQWLGQEIERFEKWEIVNSKAQGVIYNLCANHVKPLIVHEKTAKDVLAKLKQAYEQQGLAAVYRQTILVNSYLSKQFATLEEYVNKLRANRSGFEALGHNFNDDFWVSIFLNGLGEDYELVVSQILDTEKGKIVFDEAVQKVFQYDLRKAAQSTGNNQANQANAFKAQGQSSGNNNKRGNKSNGNANNGQNKNKDSEKWACRTHKTNDHKWKNCRSNPDRVDDDQPSKDKGKEKATINASIADQITPEMLRFLEKNATSRDSSEDGGASANRAYFYSIATSEIAVCGAKEKGFLIDSGASHHMTYSRTNFINFRKGSMTARLADHSEIEAEGCGDVIIDCNLDGVTVPIRFDNVWYFPDLGVNLLSIHALKEQEMVAVLERVPGLANTGLYKGNKRIASVLKEGRRYLLGTKDNVSPLVEIHREDSISALSVRGGETARLWHRRMGHLSPDYLNRLKKVADGVDFTDSFGKPCEDCILANQPRAPRKGTTSGLSTRPNQLIHTDLAGPITPASINGSKYVMTITDDYSRRVVLYFLKNKSEASHWMKHYVNLATNTSMPVAFVRVDNGGEYEGSTLLSYLREAGIYQEATVPYSPESNGVAERLNRTLTSKMRSMRKDSGLPEVLWENLLQTAAYLHNRSPNRSIGWITPFERFNGKRPDLSHLRIVGSRVYVHVPKEKRQGKFADRSKACIMLGYGNSPSIYWVYDPVDRRVFRSKDVVFDEDNCRCLAPIETMDEFDSDEDIQDAPLVDYSGFMREEPLDLPQSRVEQDQVVIDLEQEDAIQAPRLPNLLGAMPPVQPLAPTLRRSGRVVKPTHKAKEMADQMASRAVWMHLDMAAITGHKVVSYTQAIKGPDRERWKHTIEQQYQAYLDNGTWSVVPIQPGSNVLTGHWVLVEKPDRFKARWVVHGNKQVRGVDYHESPREWWLDISRKLALMGFRRCQGDQSVFVNPQGVVIILYVDDLALFAADKKAIEKAKTELLASYKLRDLGDLQAFVGIQVLRLPGKVFIYQQDYCNVILERFGYQDSRSVKTPFDDKVVLVPRQDQCPQATLKRFQEMNGSVAWLANQTRPDIAYAHSKIAQFNANPSDVAVECMNHLFRYLAGTRSWGILYEKDTENDEIVGHSDSNWGDKHSVDTKSTSGYLFTLANGPIAWSSRKQRTTATSSTEAEYIGQCNATKEAVYLRQFLKELGREQCVATTVYGDNQAALAMAQTPSTHGRTRHVEFQYHYTREKVADGTVAFSFVPTTEMAADGLTKPLNPVMFDKFRQMIGMTTLERVTNAN